MSFIIYQNTGAGLINPTGVYFSSRMAHDRDFIKNKITELRYPDFIFDLSEEEIKIKYDSDGRYSTYKIGIPSNRYIGLSYKDIIHKIYDDICKAEELE
jgi:hypothetical protein